MPPKKTGIKEVPKTPSRRANPNAIEVEESEDSRSQTLAKLAAGSVLSAFTLKTYSGCGDALEVPDLITEMKRAGDEAVSGDLSRIERMLSNQALTLDAMFNNLAERSYKQDTFKGIEVLMRLALKAQAQARSTAEALALMKNPMPYIKQANMTTGPQQVNNTYGSGGTLERSARAQAGAGDFQSEPNKLLEEDHGQRLDSGAQTKASRVNQAVEAVDKVHRASIS